MILPPGLKYNQLFIHDIICSASLRNRYPEELTEAKAQKTTRKRTGAVSQEVYTLLAHISHPGAHFHPQYCFRA
jgi:hypothetical protein